MDPTTITAIVGAVVTVASVLTNLITTPGPNAPAWQRGAYKALEVLAIVFARAKANPAAEQAALNAFLAARAGNWKCAMADSEEAYAELTGKPPSVAPTTSSVIPPVAAALMALALAGTVAASCTTTEIKEIQIACQIDAALQPILVPLAAELVPALAPIAATDEALVHPAVVAACAAIGGKPVAVIATQLKPGL